jgi:hypothetical protein
MHLETPLSHCKERRLAAAFSSAVLVSCGRRPACRRLMGCTLHMPGCCMQVLRADGQSWLFNPCCPRSMVLSGRPQLANANACPPAERRSVRGAPCMGRSARVTSCALTSRLLKCFADGRRQPSTRGASGRAATFLRALPMSPAYWRSPRRSRPPWTTCTPKCGVFCCPAAAVPLDPCCSAACLP